MSDLSPDGFFVTELRDGDVLRWCPAEQRCREGWAIVQRGRHGDLVAVDTYWHANRYVLSMRELVSATVEWNLHDFVEVDEHADNWHDFAPTDRRTLTSQHSADTTYYIRRGATPDPDAIVARAEAKVDAARDALAAALHDLARAEESLARTRDALSR